MTSAREDACPPKSGSANDGGRASSRAAAPWVSIPIPTPTPTPMEIKSRQIANHCLEATPNAALQAHVGGTKSGSGSLSESESKRSEMGFGHEKLDVCRVAIEYVVWAYRFCETRMARLLRA